MESTKRCCSRNGQDAEKDAAVRGATPVVVSLQRAGPILSCRISKTPNRLLQARSVTTSFGIRGDRPVCCLLPIPRMVESVAKEGPEPRLQNITTSGGLARLAWRPEETAPGANHQQDSGATDRRKQGSSNSKRDVTRSQPTCSVCERVQVVDRRCRQHRPVLQHVADAAGVRESTLVGQRDAAPAWSTRSSQPRRSGAISHPARRAILAKNPEVVRVRGFSELLRVRYTRPGGLSRPNLWVGGAT